MPTQPYKNEAGKRIPSVTTVLNRFKDSGGLIHWAWTQGRDGLDYRETRDSAAEAGSLAHAMVESEIKGSPFPIESNYDPETWRKASSSFEAFRKWSKQTQLIPLQTEVSLTCECHQVGGTMDAIIVQDQLSIGDWKTGNSIYLDSLIQVSAYKHLWEINNPDRPITGGFYIVRFSKTEADFAHYHWDNLDLAWRQFELFREAYDIDKKLKERL